MIYKLKKIKNGVCCFWAVSYTHLDSYDLSDEEIKAQVDSITETAQTQWDSMNKAEPELGYLWEDVNDWSTSHTIADTATRLYNLALAYSCLLYTSRCV